MFIASVTFCHRIFLLVLFVCLFVFIIFFYCDKVQVKLILLSSLKCTIMWHEVHSQCYATFTTIRSQNSSSFQTNSVPVKLPILLSPEFLVNSILLCLHEFANSRYLIYVIFVLLRLAYFLYHNVFKVHPCLLLSSVFPLKSLQ